jgi:SAM-dependent methyltransferase
MASTPGPLGGRRRGWAGWDEYAPFYDWENAKTFGRRDLGFWQRLAAREEMPVLELGCGTGRLLAPLSRDVRSLVGVDRSATMLARARVRCVRRRTRPALIRGDITALPLGVSSFGLVIAPYGMLQSLLDDQALDAAIAEMARVLRPGGLAGIDLVPDLPAWSEYRRQVSLRGRLPGGAPVTLVETVRQDRRRHMTIFDEEFIVRRGRAIERRRFSLTFRTIQFPVLLGRLDRAGLASERLYGDYRGGPLRPDSATWLILARKK